MAPNKQNGHGPGWRRFLFRFVEGLACLACVAAMISSGPPRFLPVFFAVLVGAAFCTTLALVWLTRWALRDDSRLGQFGLGSLFFLTTFAAIYFAVVRWVVVSSVPGTVAGANTPEARTFLIVGVICLLTALFLIPFLLRMADSLVWLAVWIVRQPRVRRRLLGRQHPTDGPQRSHGEE